MNGNAFGVPTVVTQDYVASPENDIPILNPMDMFISDSDHSGCSSETDIYKSSSESSADEFSNDADTPRNYSSAQDHNLKVP